MLSFIRHLQNIKIYWPENSNDCLELIGIREKGECDSKTYFPGGTVDKESACLCRRCREAGLNEEHPLGEEMATHSSHLTHSSILIVK